MIVLDLGCEQQHVFEGWFSSRAAFDEQLAAGLITCPVCGSTHVSKRLSAPYVSTRTATPPATAEAASGPAASASVPVSADQVAALRTLLRKLAQGAEDVGERFADEARSIHYGDSEERAIRGQASGGEIGELLEEGIVVLPVPPADDDLH
ncbi:MAG: DUF1178 family protein [Rhodocyclaceae bacterium]